MPVMQCGSAWGMLIPSDSSNPYTSEYTYRDIQGKLAEQANKYAGIYLSPGQNEGYLSVILQGIGV